MELPKWRKNTLQDHHNDGKKTYQNKSVMWLRFLPNMVRFGVVISSSSCSKRKKKIRPTRRRLLEAWLVFDSAQPPQEVARVAKWWKRQRLKQMKSSSSWSIKGQKSILESKPRMESSDWWRVMTKEGLEVIACWLLHDYLFSLCVAEPVSWRKKKLAWVFGFKCGGFSLL